MFCRAEQVWEWSARRRLQKLVDYVGTENSRHSGHAWVDRLRYNGLTRLAGAREAGVQPDQHHRVQSAS